MQPRKFTDLLVGGMGPSGVAIGSGDDVEVDVEDGLAADRAAVPTDIIAVGLVALVEQGFYLV